jgi:hypothetical protein
MARGPLPQSEKARRNAPTIPTTKLPAGGRKGRAPTCPYSLEKAGKAWWKWAWRQPQAAGWDDGALYSIARRASLEDDLAALDVFPAAAPLGWQVIDWIETSTSVTAPPGDVQGDVWEIDDEFALFLCWLYRVWPKGPPLAGRRLVQRGILSRPKGRAKSELAGGFVCAEALGPVRCDGFDANGDPVGSRSATRSSAAWRPRKTSRATPTTTSSTCSPRARPRTSTRSTSA